MERYPQDLQIDIDAFRRPNWKATIASGTRDGYSAMWQSLAGIQEQCGHLPAEAPTRSSVRMRASYTSWSS